MIKKLIILVFSLQNLIFLGANAQDSLVFVRSGHIQKSEIFKLIYVPVEIPKGFNSIQVEENYPSGEGKEKNVLNMGIYDPRGSAIGNPLWV